MSQTWRDSRLFRIAEDYLRAFEAWGFHVDFIWDGDGVPTLVVSLNEWA